MEKRTEVKTFEISYICDNCHEGEMLSTGVSLLTNPAQYPHICNKCFTVKNFKECYPIIRYEPVLSDMIGPIYTLGNIN